jgi:hypothetical protein
MANWKTRFNELSKRKLIPPKLIRILTVLGCALVMAAPSVDAFAKNSNSSKNHIAKSSTNISEVYVTYNGQSPSCSAGDDHITILGNGFDRKTLPNVTLGEFGELNVCPGSTSSVIVAQCPNGVCIEGDFLLKVSVGKRKEPKDSYDLTIGAIGPVGLTGLQGAPGADGASGVDGVIGEAGPAGPVG